MYWTFSGLLLLHFINLVIADDQKLEGKHLTVAVGDFPPLTLIEKNASGYVTGYSGYYMDHFVWLSQRLKFKYTMLPWDESVKPLSPDIKKKSRGTIREMLQLLYENEVDVALGPFVIRLERQDIGIGGIMGTLESSMLIKYPQSVYKSVYGTVEPFDLEVWIGIGVSLAVATGCSTLVFYISCRFLNIKLSLPKATFKLFLNLFKTIIAQGNNYRRFTRSMGILIFTWSIVAIVIVNAYYSSIISYLSTNYKKPEVSTFQELAENNRYKMLTMKGSVVEFDVATGISKALQILAEKHRRCPECSQDFNSQLFFDKVSDENYVAAIATSQAIALIDKFSHESCKLTLGRDHLKTYYAFFGVPRESPYQEELRQESLWYLAHGFTDHAEKNVLSGKARRCLLRYNSKGVQVERILSPIQLKQLFIPFAILFTGYSLATITFISEFIVFKRTNNPKTEADKTLLKNTNKVSVAIVNIIKLVEIFLKYYSLKP